MNKKIYFVSGLPRSGSTLLINILHQNPKFEVSKSTSGLHDVLFGIRNQYDTLIEHKAEIGGPDYNRLKNILLSVIESYYSTDKPVIIDKGRGWLSLIEMIIFMGIEPKILAPVRDVPEILSSFEKLWRNSTGQSQWAIEREDYIKTQTVEGRCELWCRQDQVVGLAYNRLKDALLRGHSKYIHLVEFQELTSNPSKKLKQIYDFLGEPYFNHNLDYIDQFTAEDDLGIHKIPNLHTISNKIKPVPFVANKIFGNDIFKKYQGAEFWRND